MSSKSSASPLSLSAFVIVAASSFFFCSKGVIAKLMYRQGVPVDLVLVLRMGLAFPFFLVAYLWEQQRCAVKLPARLWGKMAGLGFFGYYLSSLANFHGLQYISVGLERVVLYTYPTLVLLANWVVFNQRPTRAACGAALLAYAGISLAFWGESLSRADGDLWLGVGLVFFSAVTYALFILWSGEMLKQVGAIRFTSITVMFSCLFILLHGAFTAPLAQLAVLSPRVWMLALLIAVVGTVLPSFLLGIGLRMAGATRFAVIGSVGPILTLALSWYLLGERLNWAQALGFLISMLGALTVSLKKASA